MDQSAGIRALIAANAAALLDGTRRSAIRQWVRTFAADGTFVVGGIEVTGHARLAAFHARVVAGGVLAHAIDDVSIDVGDDGTALGETLYRLLADDGRVVGGGRYKDRFVMTDDGWRIARRIVHVDGAPPDRIVAAALAASSG